MEKSTMFREREILKEKTENETQRERGKWMEREEGDVKADPKKGSALTEWLLQIHRLPFSYYLLSLLIKGNFEKEQNIYLYSFLGVEVVRWGEKSELRSAGGRGNKGFPFSAPFLIPTTRGFSFLFFSFLLGISTYTMCIFDAALAFPRWWNSETIAVVTGANRGIGFEIARQLCGHGLTVILTSRDAAIGHEAASVLQEGGFNAVSHQLDIRDPSSIQQFVDWVQNTYGFIDILVSFLLLPTLL